MYGNDYFDVSPWGIFAWLIVAITGSAGLALIKRADVQRRMMRAWALFPAIGISVSCLILYVGLPDDRYMSPPGWHWLILLCVAMAIVVWVTAKITKRLRRNRNNI